MCSYLTGHSRPALAKLLAQMNGKKVLVLGDTMLDRFVYGDVERISPESPVPVLQVLGENEMPGGAGNVVANLCGVKTNARLISVIGDDSEGDQLKFLLKNLGVPLTGLVTDKTRPTSIKTRYLAGHQQLLRTDRENLSPVSSETETALLKIIKKEMSDSGAVIISDYGKGVLTDNIIRSVIDEADTRNVPVIVDPKGKDFRRYRGAHLITPNRRELSEAAGMDTGTDEEVVLACRQVINSCGIGAVLATRSQEGMSLVCRDGTDGFLMPIHIETQAREVFDVSGAGDTVVAVMGAALAAGADFQEAAMLANHAAGIVVGKTGTAPVLFGELENILHSSSAVHSGDSAICYGHDEAEEIINYWRGSGLKVGFTNGCFDIIHAGHVKYLAAARGLCDRLVVGLNVDESVGRLKGPERPVNDEVARAEVLAALEAVDLVVFFGRGEDEADMPVKLIGYLRPDIHFKGGDYRAEDLPEAEIVYSYGGSVEIMSLEEGRSTSKIIGKLAEKQS